jgi:hypothetical protein
MYVADSCLQSSLSNGSMYNNVLKSRHHNAGQNHNIKVANRTFENVAQFKYLVTTVKKQNLIQEESKRRSNSGNACDYSVQNGT